MKKVHLAALKMSLCDHVKPVKIMWHIQQHEMLNNVSSEMMSVTELAGRKTCKV